MVRLLTLNIKNITLNCILIIFFTLFLTVNSYSQAPGEIEWGVAPAQTGTIDSTNGASTPTDVFVEDTVTVTVTYDIAPSPVTDPLPIVPIAAAGCPGPGAVYMQNCSGTVGGITNLEFMGMNSVGNVDNCTRSQTITINFDLPVLDPTFTISDVDSGSASSPPNNWQDLVIVTGLDENGGNILPSSAVVGVNTNELAPGSIPGAVCEGNPNGVTCPGNNACFNGIASTPSTQDMSNVTLTFSGFVSEITLEYYAGNIGNNMGNPTDQFITLGPISWADTLPITLAEFTSYYSGSGVKILWTTATEVFNAGFYIYGYKENGERVRISDRLIPTKKPNSIKPQYYETLTDLGDDIVKIGMASVDVRGVEEHYGPYEIGATYGEEPQSIPIDWKRIKEEYNQKMVGRGYAMKSGKMRQVAKSQETSLFRSLASSVGLKTSSNGVKACNIAVTEEGIYRVTYDDVLAAGCDFLDNAKAGHVAVIFKGEPVPRRMKGVRGKFNSGAFFDFYALKPSGEDFLYNSQRVYQIVVDKNLRKNHINERDLPDSYVEEFRDLVSIEKNNLYDMTIPFETVGDEIEKDAWYEQFWFGFPGAGNEGATDFPINIRGDASTSENATLNLRLIGLSDIPMVELDHIARIKLNGTPIGDASYTNGGFIMWDILIDDISGSILNTGTGPDEMVENMLTVEIGGAGLPAGVGFDFIGNDSYSLEYTAPAVAVGDRVNFKGDDTGYKFSNFGTRDVQVYGYTEDGDLYKIKRKIRKLTNGSFSAKFKGVGEGTKYWASTKAQLNKGELYPSLYDKDLFKKGGDVLIVTHPSLMGNALSAYELYIQGLGHTTKIVSVLDIYEAKGFGMKGVNPIRDYIDEVRGKFGVEYVVLVGAASTVFDGMGEAINFVPSDFELTSGIIYHTPCDGCIVDFDGDYVPELKIFRIPSKLDSETMTIAQKSTDYQTDSTALLVAEQTQGGQSFSSQLDDVNNVLGGYTEARVYIDQIAADNGLDLNNPTELFQALQLAQTQMVSEINLGNRLVIFNGHASPQSWLSFDFFTDVEAMGLSNTGNPNIVLPLACFTTYYQLPENQSLADRKLFNDLGGAVVVSGAAVLSNLGDNKLFAETILEKMCSGKDLAQAVLETKQENPALTNQVINWDTIGNGFVTIDSCEPVDDGDPGDGGSTGGTDDIDTGIIDETPDE